MNAVLERKNIRISKKRQLTIPEKFFDSLGFCDEAECIVRGNELVIRPVKPTAGGEFAEQVLADLIDQGLQGNALLVAFKQEQAKIKEAVCSMLAEAKAVAEGKSEYSTYDEVFNLEDD